jgi:hypothetical protein
MPLAAISVVKPRTEQVQAVTAPWFDEPAAGRAPEQRARLVGVELGEELGTTYELRAVARKRGGDLCQHAFFFGLCE